MNMLTDIAVNIYEHHPILFWPWLLLVVAWVVVATLWVTRAIKLLWLLTRRGAQ